MGRRIILLLICSLFVSLQVFFAAPARKNSLLFPQPDGTMLNVTLLGDEFGSFSRTLDGIMVGYDLNGVYRYVISLSGDSLSFDTVFIAHDPEKRTEQEQAFLEKINQKTLSKSFLNIRQSVKAHRSDDLLMAVRTRLEAASPGDYSTSDIPFIGSLRGVLILVDFPDKGFSRDSADIVAKYDSMLNMTGYKDTVTINGKRFPAAAGSVKDYFQAQSFGQFSPYFDVIGPITADSSYIYYGKNTSLAQGSDANARELVEEVCQKAYERGLVNYEDYDVNNDGNVDFVYIVYAGKAESYTGSDPNTIWPHQWSISKTFGDMLIKYYACSSELYYKYDNIIDGIGVICHEFSHILGLQDGYSTDPSTEVFSMDAWSVMDYGCYDNNGFTPVGYTAFERFSIGWMEIEELSVPGKYQLENIALSEKAYRISSTDPNQFIILENHQKEGWYRYHASDGLLVTAVYYDKNVWINNKINNNPSLKRYYVLPADNHYSYKQSSLAGDLFPYLGNDSLTLNSLPLLGINGGQAIDKPVYNIMNSDGIVTFDYIYPNITSVTAVSTDKPVIRQEGVRVFVSAQEGSEVAVYSLSGAVVSEYNMITDHISFTLPKAGFYLLKVSGKVYKIFY